jgi:hypothetical protein
MADTEIEAIRSSLDNLENTSDSIVGTSSQFLNLDFDDAKAATDIFFQKFKVVIDTALLKNKVTLRATRAALFFPHKPERSQTISPQEPQLMKPLDP